MIEILITAICSIVFYLLGINYGKNKEKINVTNKQMDNVSKSVAIDNTPHDDIDSMYDKYE